MQRGNFRPVQQVYPRVGGETAILAILVEPGEGSIPAWAGKPYWAPSCSHGSRGSIPAWAGKPARGCRRASRAQVYPRVGGETAADRSVAPVHPGLSPRGRGNLPERRARLRLCGLSPRGRGNLCRRSLTIPTRVYPRVGGETTIRPRS